MRKVWGLAGIVFGKQDSLPFLTSAGASTYILRYLYGLVRGRRAFSVLATDLKEGVLDPFPLLRGDASPSKSKSSGRAKLFVNPLLLVTERKGTEYSLHYGAFPPDAFNTDGTLSPVGNCHRKAHTHERRIT